jgi:hypothetical protein
MENVRTLAAKILDEARVMIQANMAKRHRTSRGERWINASGRSSAAFKVEDKDGVHVRLVYKGDDVAPLDTIQYGTTGVPPISVIEQWQRDKGLEGINPWAIRTNIKKRGGTERHVEPQDWVVGPVVEAAVAALNEQLPAAAVRHVRDMLFK